MMNYLLRFIQVALDEQYLTPADVSSAELRRQPVPGVILRVTFLVPGLDDKLVIEREAFWNSTLFPTYFNGESENPHEPLRNIIG